MDFRNQPLPPQNGVVTYGWPGIPPVGKDIRGICYAFAANDAVSGGFYSAHHAPIGALSYREVAENLRTNDAIRSSVVPAVKAECKKLMEAGISVMHIVCALVAGRVRLEDDFINSLWESVLPELLTSVGTDVKTNCVLLCEALKLNYEIVLNLTTKFQDLFFFPASNTVKAFRYIKSQGVTLEANYRYLDDAAWNSLSDGEIYARNIGPYEGPHWPRVYISGWQSLEFSGISEERLRRIIDTQPICGSLTVCYDSFVDFRGQEVVYHPTSTELRLERRRKREDPNYRPVGHAVLICGYGLVPGTRKMYLLMKNSWGRPWADGGYAKVDPSIFQFFSFPNLVGLSCVE